MMERALIEYAINALWQVPLLAGSAWLLLRMVRPAPVTQHRVWLAVLGLALLLPLHGMGGGISRVGATRHTGTVIETSRAEAFVPPPRSGLPPAPGQRFAFTPLFSARTSSFRLTTRTVHWLLSLYVATIVIGLFRITRAWLAARNLVQDSQEICLSDRDRTALDELQPSPRDQAATTTRKRRGFEPHGGGRAGPGLAVARGICPAYGE